jgi:hypothetical protein
MVLTVNVRTSGDPCRPTSVALASGWPARYRMPGLSASPAAASSLPCGVGAGGLAPPLQPGPSRGWIGSSEGATGGGPPA